VSAAAVRLDPHEIELGDGSLVVMSYDGEQYRLSLFTIEAQAGRPRVKRYAAQATFLGSTWAVVRLAAKRELSDADFVRYVRSTSWGAELP